MYIHVIHVHINIQNVPSTSIGYIWEHTDSENCAFHLHSKYVYNCTLYVLGYVDGPWLPHRSFTSPVLHTHSKHFEIPELCACEHLFSLSHTCVITIYRHVMSGLWVSGKCNHSI